MNECSSAPSSDQLRSSSLSNSVQENFQLSPTAADGAAGASDPTAASSADLGGDAEGVWSADIDQAFQEALAIYPPCGRRKIIISDEGKMYGRNELIARYIKIRCGKTRTRKQVSSHIQVLARKKARDDAAKKKADQGPIVVSPAAAPSLPPPTATAAAVPTLPVQQPPRVPATVANFPQLPGLPLADTKDQLAMQLLQNTLAHQKMYGGLAWPNIMQQPFNLDIKQFPVNVDMKPFQGEIKFPGYGLVGVPPHFQLDLKPETPEGPLAVAVASSELQLNSFTAYVQAQGTRVDIVSIPPSTVIEPLNLLDIAEKFPKELLELYEKGPKDAFYLAKCWANVHFDVNDPNSSLFVYDSCYTSSKKFDIRVSSRVCSFGEEQIEKTETFEPIEENGHYTFRVEKSAMCEYMVRFIYKLKELENEEWMNNVLENFTVFQKITNVSTEEILMVLCFTFEINKEPDTTCSLFKLIKA